ncbi:MAG: CBS domain-containing protein [Leptospirales bacterium]|nr:CBS domain-containing protein [Leptospirales bacterium]
MSDEQLKQRLLERTQHMLEASVEELMTREVITVDYNDLCAKAARILLEHHFLAVLVLKEGKPFNIATAHDLLRLGYEEVYDANRDYLRMKVGDLVKDKEFVSVRSGTRLRDLLNIMVAKKIRTVPVIDEQFVRGVVSLTDMVRWYRDTHDEIKTGRL